MNVEKRDAELMKHGFCQLRNETKNDCWLSEMKNIMMPSFCTGEWKFGLEITFVQIGPKVAGTFFADFTTTIKCGPSADMK